jgi:hypothetical protein
MQLCFSACKKAGIQLFFILLSEIYAIILIVVRAPYNAMRIKEQL